MIFEGVSSTMLRAMVGLFGLAVLVALSSAAPAVEEEALVELDDDVE